MPNLSLVCPLDWPSGQAESCRLLAGPKGVRSWQLSARPGLPALVTQACPSCLHLGRRHRWAPGQVVGGPGASGRLEVLPWPLGCQAYAGMVKLGDLVSPQVSTPTPRHTNP
jgi:hypothetical protein